MNNCVCKRKSIFKLLSVTQVWTTVHKYNLTTFNVAFTKFLSEKSFLSLAKWKYFFHCLRVRLEKCEPIVSYFKLISQYKEKITKVQSLNQQTVTKQPWI